MPRPSSPPDCRPEDLFWSQFGLPWCKMSLNLSWRNLGEDGTPPGFERAVSHVGKMARMGELMRRSNLFRALLALNLLLILGRVSLGAEPSTATGTAGAKGAAAGVFAQDVLPFLSKHCYACHGNGKSKGDLTLDQYRDEPSVEKARKVWDNVVEMVGSGEMP